MVTRRVHIDTDILASVRPMWGQPRTPEQLALGDIIDGYLVRLRRDQQDLLRETVYERKTYDEVGLALGISRHAALRRAQTARRALVRLIALDDPCFQEYEARLVRPQGGQARDYEAEANAAYGVIQRRLGDALRGGAVEAVAPPVAYAAA